MKSCFVCQRLCGAWLKVRYSHCLAGKSCCNRSDSPFLWISVNSNTESKQLSKSMKDEPSRLQRATGKGLVSSLGNTEPKLESCLKRTSLTGSAQNFCQSPDFFEDQENILEYSRCTIDQIKYPKILKQSDVIAKKLLASVVEAENYISSLDATDAPKTQIYCNANSLRKAHNITYCKTLDASHFAADVRQRLDTCRFASNHQKKKESSSESQIIAMETISLQITEQLPCLFTKMDDCSIYSNNLIFQNHILGVMTRGLRLYKMQVQFYRWMKKIFWTDLTIDILKLTKHSDDNTIKVRWQVRGLPKYNIPFILLSRGYGERQQWHRYGDYFSILHVGESGLVEKHHLMKMQPTRSLKKKAAVLSLLPFLSLAEDPIFADNIKEEPVLPSSNQSAKIASPLH